MRYVHVSKPMQKKIKKALFYKEEQIGLERTGYGKAR